MIDDLQLLTPLLNPWNGVVAISTILAIEVLKYTAPVFFGNDGRGNRLLRLMSVGGCALGYQIPGPWTAGDWTMNLFVGGLVGMVSTLGYALVADAVKFFRTKDPRPEQAIKWSEAAKKWATVIGALAAALSGVYAAWFKPEVRAREGYEITAAAVEVLSRDVSNISESLNDMIQAHNHLDKNLSVELAKVVQRLDDFEDMAKRRYAYEAKPTVVIERRSAPMDHPPPVDENIQMPTAFEVFK